MEKNLSKQVYIYSLSTDAFYTEEERELKKKLSRLEDFRRLRRKRKGIEKNILEIELKLKQVDDDIEKENLSNKVINLKRQHEYFDWLKSIFPKISDPVYKNQTKKLRDDIDKLTIEFRELVDKNQDVRQLNKNQLNPKAIVSLFESTLTRKLGMDTKAVNPNEDIIIVEIFNNKVLKDLLKKGFYHNDELYIYYSSSSGQLRDKKTMWIKKSKWDEVGLTLMCGLTEADINNRGGMSVNKFLSYKALSTSASIPWDNFKSIIDNSIVIDDVKVLLNRTVDYIDRKTYEIERKENYPVEIEITDGAGMVLPSVSEDLFGKGKYKNFQFRAPFMKGLLSCFPFDEMLKQDGPIYVKDAWGTLRDIKEASIIFFKSQIKMAKYFDSWDQYKENFKEFDCEAAIMNIEEDTISDAKLNYQYIQSLLEVSDKELDELVKSTNEVIDEIGSNKEKMLEIMGADNSNENKNYLQQALSLYPELLNEEHVKQTIKMKKKAIVKDARAGKLNIEGKFTYVLPDWYYVLNRVVYGEGKALLKEDQIHCNLFREGKLDCLRSPSLSFEHVVQQNISTPKVKDWFLTQGVYVSPYSMIGKILQMDYDGDRILLSSNVHLTTAAERNKKLLDVVPLHYDMGVADPVTIDAKNIYDSLIIAFRASSSIGGISNNISKVWNAGKEHFDYKVIRQQTAYNNFVIDASKTLDLPEPPPDVLENWEVYNVQKLPYFFRYVKDKKIDEVLVKNESTVNRLGDKVSSKKIHFKTIVNKFDYRMLLNTYIEGSDNDIDGEIVQRIIDTYTYFDQNKRKYMSDEESSDKKSKKSKRWIYNYIRKELLEIEADPIKVTDVLITYLYKQNDSPFKTTLWECFGKEIVQNLSDNLENVLVCKDCNCRFRKVINKKSRCEECQNKHETKMAKERKRKEREKKKCVTNK